MNSRTPIKYTVLIIVFCICIMNISCSGPVGEKKPPMKSEREISERLMEINRYVVKRNIELTENFVRRTGWDMKRTETGLWYMILKNGEGRIPGKGDRLVISQEIWLLDGSLVELKDSEKVRSFTVANGEVEAGIEEGVLLMRKGSEAKFILPPYLSNGDYGYSNRIPSGSILIYDVKLLEAFPND